MKVLRRVRLVLGVWKPDLDCARGAAEDAPGIAMMPTFFLDGKLPAGCEEIVASVDSDGYISFRTRSRLEVEI